MRNLHFFLLGLAATLIVGFASVSPLHPAGTGAPQNAPRIAVVTPGTAAITPLPADPRTTDGRDGCRDRDNEPALPMSRLRPPPVRTRARPGRRTASASCP